MVKATLAEQAYVALRDLIIGGQLAAGQRLMPEELGQMLSISPTPIKEALTRLQLDGLVDATSRRGVLVRTFNAADVTELYQARLMIESDAIRRGLRAGRVDDDFLARLAACAAAYGRQTRPRSRNELLDVLRPDHDLHAMLASLGGNSRVSAWHEQILRQTQTVRIWSPDSYAFALACKEHTEIVDALSRRDENGAVQALERHLARSSSDLLEQTPPDTVTGG
jgi:DNA-binding GntR family transcriptional regulator